jgi:2-polyprenyl-6-methoxyphenol hydroxylase-like FAD-dependent oxidoreductase
MSRITSATIVGGGIAGPVTALALQKAGIDSVIYEAYSDSADGVGGILMLAPNGLNALRTIGADEVARSLGWPIPRMVIANGAGKEFGAFPALADVPVSRVMWRSDLYRALQDHAVARGVRIEYGKRLQGVDETPDGVVARFTDGTTAVAGVLIGADGINSTVRSLIDPYAPGPAYTGLLGFGGYSSFAGAPGSSDTMSFVFGDRGFFGYWKERDDRVLWFANLPHPKPMTQAQTLEISLKDWLLILREAYRDDVPAREILRHVRPEELLAFGSMNVLPSVPHWYRERMVLVGDAAHAPSSSSGQGVSLAAESAIELARCLRDLPDLPEAFAAYEGLRRPRVEKIAAEAAKTNRDKQSGPISKAIMNVVMPVAMRFVNSEKMFGPVHRYRIDWNSRVAPAS